MTQRVLTGITTTGTLHLGNYVGAVRRAIAASRAPGVESFFFMADYHALIKCDEPDRIEASRLQIAATWLAAGLDTSRVVFYRQSDIPEIPELTWLLTCVTSKGQMNRAHAYKASVDANLAAGEDADAGVTMGLYSYPILMAADILMFNAHRVPVGKDQVQHIEMARDVAQRFNHLFGRGEDFFVLPEASIDEEMELLPGLDGRKMSKSYDNVIPLFEGGSKALKDAIARIVTDSKLPGEPKEPEGSHLVQIYDAFATPAQREAFRAALRAGLAWGEAKQQLFELIEAEIGPMRARYDALMAEPERIETILMEGAARARALAAPLLQRLREAVGLRRFQPLQAKAAPQAKAKSALPVFKQYREADGQFYFKLNAADGGLLLQSQGFAQGREAGQWVARLKKEGVAALAQAPVQRAEGVAEVQLHEALQALQAAESQD
ncbi:tryptophan--tRNA ligase [Kinneretia asaccharophila]|uniref:Tryptophan--tRNA ligase n=1 Tax=Roseateles asaccharophilus TaxID=582607 RepID=A0A4V3CKA1_9BURK|nr:tryptophan--tRNA ligase [Roseateles asaccharophilus]MDN3543174.1 tryptophan--tRNA ligase [Roseateles asaccharophilus]TDP13127.1 tryptophanyl-tRNA synthetase [Roseateles asaccharophilus]